MLPEARRSWRALLSGYIKAQFSSWEVCLFHVLGLIYIFTVLAWHLSGDGSARTAMSTRDIDQAISSRGRESLPMNPYTAAYSGAAVIIPVMGTLALASQVSRSSLQLPQAFICWLYSPRLAQQPVCHCHTRGGHGILRRSEQIAVQLFHMIASRSF